MGQKQAKDVFQRKYSFGMEQDIQEVKIDSKREELEKAINSYELLQKDQNVENIPITLYKKYFTQLKLLTQISLFNSVNIEDVEGISLSLINITGEQNITTFLNNMEFLKNLKTLKRMQFDIVDMNSAYFSHFIQSLNHITSIEDLIIFTLEESPIDQSEFQQLITWIGKQNNMKKLTLSFKLPLKIDTTFSQHFEHFQFLERLRLKFVENCEICSNGLIELGNSISKFFRLIVLTLEIQSNQQNIDCISLNALGQSVKGLQMLEQFSFALKQDNTSQEVVASLYNILQQITNLRHFQIYLENNNPKLELRQQLEMKNQNSIFNEIVLYHPFQNLTYLIVNLNIQQENTSSLTRLSQMLPFMVNLELAEINIDSYGQLQEEDYLLFFKGLETLNTLKDLDLKIGSYNNFNSKSALLLKRTLLSLTNLMRFSITVDELNAVDINAVQSIYEGLLNTSTLTTLSIELHHPYQLIFIGLLQNCREMEDSNIELCYFEKLLFERQPISNNLAKLNLHLKNMCTDGIKGLAEGLKELTFLNYLNISFKEAHIGRSEYKQMGESLTALKNLVCLQFSFEEKDNSVFMDFGESLKQLSNLQFLLLTVSSLDALSGWLPQLSNLKKISLCYKIENMGNRSINLWDINNLLLPLSNLTYVHLEIQSLSQITYTHIEHDQGVLQQQLSKMNSLKHFNISVRERYSIPQSSLSLSDQLTKSLPIYFESALTLQKLSLCIQRNNYFSEDSILLLSNQMQKLSHLNYLTLQIDKSQQRFSNETICQLLKSFEHLFSLNSFTLYLYNFYLMSYYEMENLVMPNLISSLKKLPIRALSMNYEFNLRRNRVTPVKHLNELFSLKTIKDVV